MGRHQLLGWFGFTVLMLFAIPAILPESSKGIDLGTLAHAGVLGLIVIGLSMLLGYTGQISLGHAAFFAIGAYASALFGLHFTPEAAAPVAVLPGLTPAEAARPNPLWPALLPWVWIGAGMLLSGAVAFLIGKPALRLKGHYLAMATLGFGVIVHHLLIGLHFTGGASESVPMTTTLTAFGYDFTGDRRLYLLVWALVCVVLLLSLLMIHSRVGRALRAVHGDETAARSLGVNVARFKVQIFVLSAVLASLAGSLHGHRLLIVPPSSFELHTSVLVVVMVVVGGMANVWAALMGCVFLVVLEEKLRQFQDWMLPAYGLVLILVMIFLPQGVFVASGQGLRRLYRAVDGHSTRREAP